MALERLTTKWAVSDADWLLQSESVDPQAEPAIESIYALLNGYIGTRGSLEEGGSASRPASFLAGVYNRPAGPQEPELEDPIPEIVVMPDWCRLELTISGVPVRADEGEIVGQRRTMDLRQGCLLREWHVRDESDRVTQFHSRRFVSLADRHLLSYTLALTPTNHDSTIDLRVTIDTNVTNRNGVRHLALKSSRPLPIGVLSVARTTQSGVTIAWAGGGRLRRRDGVAIPAKRLLSGGMAGQHWTWMAERGEEVALEWIVAVYTTRDVSDPASAAADDLRRATDVGVSQLMSAHSDACRERWVCGDIEVTGRPEIQRAVRFASYHLIGSANPEDERSSVGARSLTGERYRGHVFWDTELFVWPFHLYTHPETARALLLYRYHTLDAARARARGLGYKGALFAWESADTGEETTPAFVRGPRGERVPVLTGIQEHHIAADVGYAVLQYLTATHDDAFLLDYGAEMLVEIARFWLSRTTRDRAGALHIKNVIGPDEYHDSVDDNAYTNVLVRHLLRRTARLASTLQVRHPDRWAELSRTLGVAESEPKAWDSAAGQLVDNFDPKTGLFEQFSGYYGLREVDLTGHDPAIATMDEKLGWRALRKTNVLKQADVVMLLYLLWDEFPSDVRLANYRYYASRCAHDSSLSAAIHALVGARLGDADAAERLLLQALYIDLDTSHRAAAGAADGVHIASCGGAWQAVVFGFLGVQADEQGLRIRPVVPARWGLVRTALRWRGNLVRLAVDANARSVGVSVEGIGSAELAVGDGGWQTVPAGERIEARY